MLAYLFFPASLAFEVDGRLFDMLKSRPCEADNKFWSAL
jgi:hypothetical protein